MMALEETDVGTVPRLEDMVARGQVHFVGVGGAGMCALAELVLRSGHVVSGCDLRPGTSTERLVELGARIDRGHAGEHVGQVAGLVVSAAVPDDHPELAAARERGVPILKRAQALGQWVRRGRVVGIAGTHGKTSTTAMATEVFVAAGSDPTGLVGGRVGAWRSNLRYGSDDLFVVEADEYDRSFHEIEPDVAVVTNLEADHLDTYGDLQGVLDGFHTYLEGLAPDGRAVVCGDDHGASRLLPRLGGRGYTYGLNPGVQLRALDPVVEPTGTRFRVLEDGEEHGEVWVPAPGYHNLRNALGAAGAARWLGVAWDDIRVGLAQYRGVGRRFELVGEAGGVVIVDDYAHHPTEVLATVATVRRAYPTRRVVAVFQPHLYTRTRDFADEFAGALSDADVIWVTDVFPAREEPIPGVTGELVTRAAAALGRAPAIHYEPDLDALPARLAESVDSGDVVLVMGAGSIERTGEALLSLLGGGSGGTDA